MYSLCLRFVACSVFDLQDPIQACLTIFSHKMPSNHLWVSRKISLKNMVHFVVIFGLLRVLRILHGCNPCTSYPSFLYIILLFLRCFNILWCLLINYCDMSEDDCCRSMLKHNHHLKFFFQLYAKICFNFVQNVSPVMIFKTLYILPSL